MVCLLLPLSLLLRPPTFSQSLVLNLLRSSVGWVSQSTLTNRARERERERERGRQTRPNRSYASAFPASSLVSSRLFSHVSSLTSFSHLISSPISFRLSCPLLCPPVPPFDRFFSKVL